MTPTTGSGDHIEFKAPVDARNLVGKGTLNDHSTHLHLPGAASPVALQSLPRGPVQLVGRDDQVKALLELLNPKNPQSPQGSPVVVSAVAGLAGVGKTALALHVAHHATAQGWFPGGTVFMDLHGYDETTAPVDPAHALGSLLRALGTPDHDLPPDTEGQAALYRSRLADLADHGRLVLLVLDNTSTAAGVHPLLPGRSGHRVLITSRDTLATLPDVRMIDLDTLTPDHATTLITTALRTARPDDPRPQQEPEALSRIAHLCGYLPLALQITAALLNADPHRRLATLARELTDTRTRLATLSYPDTDGRQLAVHTAFHLSYQRLTPDQARTFRLLSLCQGPDTGIDAVAALTGTTPREALGHMTALARAHLIEPTTEDRWRTHDLIHLYATDLTQHTDDTPTREQALDHLLAYYTHTADAANDHLRALPGDNVPDRFTDRADALDWLDSERPNLIAATAQAAATDRHDTTLTLAICLTQYLHWRRRFEEAITTGELAVKAARQSGNRHGEGMALNNLGLALREVRRFEEAIAAHELAAQIRRESGDRHNEGAALNNLGVALREVRRFEEAITAHQQAAQIRRESGDRHNEGAALNNLGLALQEVRRFEEAITTHQQAAQIFRETGDRHNEGAALNNLGVALQQVRRFEEAITAHQQAGQIFRETSDRHGEGMALGNLGAALREVRRFEEAITAHEEDLAICRETSDRHGEGMALGNLGAALREVRRFEEAITAHEQAGQIFRESGDRHREGMALNNLADTLSAAKADRWPVRWWRRIRRGDGAT
jgi:tetratricopeptide (TPR) repeat protein